MVLDAVSNFVRGNTDAEVGTEDTTVSVVDASIFPDPETDGEFNVVIWDVNNFPRPDQDVDVEILRVTERDTTDDELTVVRGQETTSAAAHPEGSAVHLSPTAKMFSDIEGTFADFWDADTEELTADVNNTNTTTQSLEAETTTTETLEADNVNNIIFASDVGSLQDAIDEATDGDFVVISDEYNETVTINNRLTILGSFRSGHSVVVDSDQPAVTVADSDVTIKGIRMRNNGSGPALESQDTDRLHVTNCQFDASIIIDSSSRYGQIIGNDLGGETIDLNGENYAVVGNSRAGTINDNGSGNEVSSNA